MASYREYSGGATIVSIGSRRFGAGEHELEERRVFFNQIVTTKSQEPILWHTENQKHYTIKEAFKAALHENAEILDAITPDAAPRPVKLQVDYTDDASHFVVKTGSGEVRVLRIDFDAELSVTTEHVPVARLSDYVCSGSSESIAQSAAFEFSALGTQLSLEFHKRGDTGETQVLIRRTGPPFDRLGPEK